MKKRIITLFLTLLILTIFITGCGAGKENAERVMKNYFDSVKNKDFNQTLTLYSPQFFEKTSKEEVGEMLNTVNKKLGDLQSYQLEGWKVTKRVGTGSGTYYNLQYKVTYSKYSSEETFNLYEPNGSNDFKILGFNINSEGLLK